MGSNGLDLKKAGKGFYAAGNRERQAERSLGEGRMQSGTQALAANAAPWVQPIPPRGQGPDPCPRRPRSNRRPAAGGRPGRRWKSGRACEPAQPRGAALRATHHFPSGRRRCRISRAPLRMARQPPPFLPWLAPGSASPT